jgi:hypothetical protein
VPLLGVSKLQASVWLAILKGFILLCSKLCISLAANLIDASWIYGRQHSLKVLEPENKDKATVATVAFLFSGSLGGNFSKYFVIFFKVFVEKNFHKCLIIRLL